MTSSVGTEGQAGERPLGQQAEFLAEKMAEVRREISKAIVGQAEVVEGVLIALLAGGHVLLEGAPGLGKTMLVRTLAQAVALKYSRIQFTPDLMPADVIGTSVVQENGDGQKVARAFSPAQYLPICCWRMKSTARRPRRNRRCWRPCRKSRSPWRTLRTCWRNLFS